MSELRRNEGPDDGDRPADKPEKADKPAERPGLEMRSADMNEKWPVRRHCVTPAQREFIRTGAGTDSSPAAQAAADSFSLDWSKGRSLDKEKPPPGRKKPDFTTTPEDIDRDNATLEAHTLQRAEDVTRFERFSDVQPERRKSRGAWDKVVEKSDDVVEKVGDVADALDGIIDAPRPTGSLVGHAPDNAPHMVSHYGGPSAGDVVTAVTAIAFVGMDLSRRMHRKIGEWKDKDAGNG